MNLDTFQWCPHVPKRVEALQWQLKPAWRHSSIIAWMRHSKGSQTFIGEWCWNHKTNRTQYSDVFGRPEMPGANCPFLFLVTVLGIQVRSPLRKQIEIVYKNTPHVSCSWGSKYRQIYLNQRSAGQLPGVDLCKVHCAQCGLHCFFPFGGRASCIMGNVVCIGQLFWATAERTTI